MTHGLINPIAAVSTRLHHKGNETISRHERKDKFNPLMTEFLSSGTHFYAFNTWHLRRCSSPTVSALKGPDLVTQAHMGSPSRNSINDLPEPKLLGVRGGDINQPDFML